MLGSARAAMMVKNNGGVSYPAAIASYAFSEASGASTADSSGNNRTGTLSDPTIRTVSGHTGNGIDNSVVTGTVAVPAAGWAPTTAITLMAWVFRSDWSVVGRRAAGIYAANQSDDGFIIAASRGGSPGPMIVITTSNTSNFVLQPNQNVLTSGWHHLAATYDGTTLAFYVDGVQTGSTLGVTGSLSLDTPGSWLLGGSPGAGQLQGRIDDVRFFNVALTAAEVNGLKDIPV